MLEELGCAGTWGRISPCMECAERTHPPEPDCHGRCERYAEYRAGIDKQREPYAMAKDAVDFSIEGILTAQKRRHRSRRK